MTVMARLTGSTMSQQAIKMYGTYTSTYILDSKMIIYIKITTIRHLYPPKNDCHTLKSFENS